MEIRTFNYTNANNDEQPVIIVLDDNDDNVLGLNLHYLNDPLKIINLIAQASRHDTFNIYENVIQGHKELESCIRRYTHNYIRGL
jgi:hypothetical protein